LYWGREFGVGNPSTNRTRGRALHEADFAASGTSLLTAVWTADQRRDRDNLTTH